jgi:hypothetical protein
MLSFKRDNYTRASMYVYIIGCKIFLLIYFEYYINFYGCVRYGANIYASDVNQTEVYSTCVLEIKSSTHTSPGRSHAMMCLCSKYESFYVEPKVNRKCAAK